MLIALLHLGASRRVCAQVMLACLQELRPHLTAAALSGPLASLERLATYGMTDTATYQRARASCDAQPAPPAGAAALAALALSSAISLLDLTDQAPVQGAEMDCMAEALYEAGQSSDLNDARAHLADTIRRALPTLAALSSPTSTA